jgi:hypothetical protein
VQGQDLREICAKAPMPIAEMFFDWVREHQEAREICRSVLDLATVRGVAKRLGLDLFIWSSDWEEQVRLNLERGFPGDWIDRKYIPPDWRKVYPSVGQPPVWRTESMQAYAERLNAKTALLEPRDLNELRWTKQATDAEWEAQRLARLKNEWLARNLSRGSKMDFKSYQALDIAYTRALKRHDHALREIVRWRKGLGAKMRALPDCFLDEALVAKRYRMESTENYETAADIAGVRPSVAPGSDMASVSSPGSLAGTVDAAPKRERDPNCMQAAQRPEGTSPGVCMDNIMEATVMEAVMEASIVGLNGRKVVPSVAAADEAADSRGMMQPIVVPAEGPPMVAASVVATNAEAPVSSSPSTVEGIPRIVPPNGAADVAGKIKSPGAALEPPSCHSCASAGVDASMVGGGGMAAASIPSTAAHRPG